MTLDEQHLYVIGWLKAKGWTCSSRSPDSKNINLHNENCPVCITLNQTESMITCRIMGFLKDSFVRVDTDVFQVANKDKVRFGFLAKNLAEAWSAIEYYSQSPVADVSRIPLFSDWKDIEHG